MKNKTFALIMTFICLVIGVLIFYIYSLNNDVKISVSISDIIKNKDKDDDDEKTGEEESGGSSSHKPSEDTLRNLEQVTSYDEFFNIDGVINSYYEYITQKDYGKLLKILDASYIKNHKITKNNAKEVFATEYQDISFYSKEMYVKGKNNAEYYFVKGETQLYNFYDEEIREGESIYFLVIVDTEKSTYSIYPLNSVSSTYEYAKNYNLPKSKNIEDNSYNTYYEKNYSDEMVAIYYVNYYRSIVYMNTEKAYGMLGASSKTKYYDLETFTNNLEDIYSNKLNSRFTGYNATGEDGKKTYTLNNGNEGTIVITEEAIMNFTIDL